MKQELTKQHGFLCFHEISSLLFQQYWSKAQG